MIVQGLAAIRIQNGALAVNMNNTLIEDNANDGVVIRTAGGSLRLNGSTVTGNGGKAMEFSQTGRHRFYALEQTVEITGAK